MNSRQSIASVSVYSQKMHKLVFLFQLKATEYGIFLQIADGIQIVLVHAKAMDREG